MLTLTVQLLLHFLSKHLRVLQRPLRVQLP